MIQEPLGYDTKGRPVWAVNDAGRPVCGANRKKGPCQSTARMENGRCRLCGGATPTGEDHPRYRTGEYSQDRLKREALLNRLAFSTAAEPGSDPMLERVVQVLRQNVDEGNFTAKKATSRRRSTSSTSSRVNLGRRWFTRYPTRIFWRPWRASPPNSSGPIGLKRGGGG